MVFLDFHSALLMLLCYYHNNLTILIMYIFHLSVVATDKLKTGCNY